MNALYKISPLFCLFTHFTSIQALNDFKEKHKINMAHVFQEINNRETLKNALKVKIINGLPVINKKFDYVEEESEDEEDLITYYQNSTKQEDFYASDQLIKDDQDKLENFNEENDNNNNNDDLSDNHETTEKTSTAGKALWCITLIAWFMKSSH